MPEDEQHATVAFVVLDVARRSAVWEKVEPSDIGDLSPFARGWAWWSSDGASLYSLRQSCYPRSLEL